MPRSVNHVASKARRKKTLKLAKGYFGRRKNVWTVAKNAVEKGLTYNTSALEINRKVLADLAMNDPAGFKAIFDQIMNG